MKRLVFLDFDGVVMTEETYTSRGGGRWSKPRAPENPDWLHDHALELLDRRCVAVLSEMCVRASADVVLSTSWRGHTEEDREQLERALWDAGLDRRIPVIGQTPRKPSNVYRGVEIGWWLAANRPGWTYDACVVLDDDGDLDPFLDRWVRSWFRAEHSPHGYSGLGPAQLTEALALWGLS